MVDRKAVDREEHGPVLEHLVCSPWFSKKANGLRLLLYLSIAQIAYNRYDLSLST